MQEIYLGESNKFLSGLPHAEYQRLLSKAEVVSLTKGQVLSEVDLVPRYVYFPLSCLLSLNKIVDGHVKFALCIVGREGAANVMNAVNGQSAYLHTEVLCSGQALRMKLKSFADEMQLSAALNRKILQYAIRLGGQFAQAAECNGFHLAEKRVARWLLLLRNALGSNNFYVTHETLSGLAGIRRVGITNAAFALKQGKLIDYTRGYVNIVDLPGLQEVACCC